MDILEKLGIDYTVFYQMGLFLIAYIVAAKFAFGPYLKAFQKREELTMGNEELADELDSEIEQLENTYQSRARDLNVKMQKIFEAARAEATAEQNRKITSARSDAEQLVKDARARVEDQKQQASSKLKGALPDMSQSVVSKMLGRGV